MKNRNRPLAGIRVLELGAYIAGPYATSILKSLGAEVVKVEPPKGGDAFRRAVNTKSPYFVQFNSGKKSVAVDLKSPEGLAVVKGLIPQFDVVLENSRPGKMASLGLGAEDVRRINPSVVYASVSGFGDGGEWRDRAAYDSIGQSMGGLYSVLSDAGDPKLSGTCLADLITAISTAMGILASLVGRSLDPDREGTHLRTSILEATTLITIDAMTLLHESGVSPTRESRHPQGQVFCLRASDDRALTVHMSSSQKFWQAFAKTIGRPDLAQDPRFADYDSRTAHYYDLRPILEEAFRTRTSDDWERLLVENDVPYAPVLTLDDLTRHSQTEFLEIFEQAPNGLNLVRLPWLFDGERPSRQHAAPLLGEHTTEIAQGVLSQAEVRRLIEEGVLFQAPDTEPPLSQPVQAG